MISFSKKTKTIATIIAGVMLALSMGLQSLVFGENDLKSLSDQVANLTKRLEALESNGQR